jgi:hypothetical protein
MPNVGHLNYKTERISKKNERIIENDFICMTTINKMKFYIQKTKKIRTIKHIIIIVPILKIVTVLNENFDHTFNFGISCSGLIGCL